MDVHFADSFGMHLLHAAALIPVAAAAMDATRTFLRAGANPNAATILGICPIHLAAKYPCANPYTESKSTDTPDDYWRLVTRVLHELAHTTSEPHDKLFYDTQRFYLNVASKDLKWPVKVTCRICCHNKGQCSKQVCPMCNWIEDPTMDACGGAASNNQLTGRRRSPLPPFCCHHKGVSAVGWV